MNGSYPTPQCTDAYHDQTVLMSRAWTLKIVKINKHLCCYSIFKRDEYYGCLFSLSVHKETSSEGLFWRFFKCLPSV